VPALQGGVTQVSVGFDFACALLSDATVDCWGDNGFGELGDGTMASHFVPMPAVGVTGATSISTGFGFACATTATDVLCWGTGGLCQLGNGPCVSSPTPVSVSGLSGATKVACGYQSACAIVDGGAYCWGAIATGDPTVDPFLGASVPVPVAGIPKGSGATDIAVGYASACAIVKGAAQCWGENTAGQIGNGGAVNALVATRVSGFR
jgi:alpha-tubulin suppressor-like RCC1 family protein